MLTSIVPLWHCAQVSASAVPTESTSRSYNHDKYRLKTEARNEIRGRHFCAIHTNIQSYIQTYMQTYMHTYMQTYMHTYIHVVNFDALAQASDFRIKRRQIVFLCWMPVPMISKHSAQLTPLPFDIRTWLWRYTYLLLISMLWHRQAIFESKGDNLSFSAECRIRTQRVSESQSPADWMPADKLTELSRIKLKTWTRQPVPMIRKHSAHLTPLPFAIRTWLWRYAYLLLLISMLWHRQAIFKSKGDKLSSSAECRRILCGRHKGMRLRNRLDGERLYRVLRLRGRPNMEPVMTQLLEMGDILHWFLRLLFWWIQSYSAVFRLLPIWT